MLGTEKKSVQRNVMNSQRKERVQAILLILKQKKSDLPCSKLLRSPKKFSKFERSGKAVKDNGYFFKLKIRSWQAGWGIY